MSQVIRVVRCKSVLVYDSSFLLMSDTDDIQVAIDLRKHVASIIETPKKK